jgi:sulfite exporter TauE/SafE
MPWWLPGILGLILIGVGVAIGGNPVRYGSPVVIGVILIAASVILLFRNRSG